jgi:ferric-dicitrate binding protein FerR (iron transport regulator)
MSGPIAAERAARVRTAVYGAWSDECLAPRVKTRRRLTVAVLFAAAASLVIAAAMWSPIRTPAPGAVARIDQVTEQATGSRAPFVAGDAVRSGSTVTTSAFTLAMTLTTGVHLRLDASSTARVESATDIVLERGAVYVDSAGVHATKPDAFPITIRTPTGAVVRDVGTRFEVRLTSAGMRIRVRDGEVRVTYGNGAEARAGAGQELFLEPDGSNGSISHSLSAATRSEWAWAERAAPPFSVERSTLGAFLDWVSREGAWTVTFADSGSATALRATVLYGRSDLLKGLTPAEALDVILPTCGLRHYIDASGRVVIARDTSQGAIR